MDMTFAETQNFFDDIRNKAEEAKSQMEHGVGDAKGLLSGFGINLAETEGMTLSELGNFFDDLRNKAEEAKQ